MIAIDPVIAFPDAPRLSVAPLVAQARDGMSYNKCCIAHCRKSRDAEPTIHAGSFGPQN